MRILLVCHTHQRGRELKALLEKHFTELMVHCSDSLSEEICDSAGCRQLWTEVKAQRCHFVLFEKNEFVTELNFYEELATAISPAHGVVMVGADWLTDHINQLSLNNLWIHKLIYPFSQENFQPVIQLLRQLHERGGAKTSRRGRAETLAIRPIDFLEVLLEDTLLNFSEVLEILHLLFPDARGIHFEHLLQSSSTSTERAKSILLQAYDDDKFVPLVIKLEKTHNVESEVDRFFRYIDRRLVGARHTYIVRHKNLWDLGAIAFSLVGAPLGDDRDSPIESFSKRFQDATNSPVDIDNLYKALQDLFNNNWRRLYRDTQEPTKSTFFEQYSEVWSGSGGSWTHKIESFYQANPTPFVQYHGIDLTNFSVSLPNPVHWALQNRHRGVIHQMHTAISHGDMHADNILVDNSSQAWSIDFERSGRGPRLQDFVELEVDLITHRSHFDERDLVILYDLAYWLSLPRLSSEPIDYLAAPARVRRDDRAYKLAQTIPEIRRLANELTNYGDQREYLWGLLLNTVFLAQHTEKDSSRQRAVLLLGGVICQRLQQWMDNKHDSWPEGWPQPIMDDETLNKYEIELQEEMQPQSNDEASEDLPSTPGSLTSTYEPPIILFLAANPDDTAHLRLDREARAIKDALRKAEVVGKFKFEQEWTTRIDDLRTNLLRYKPTIVHFSGHGRSGEIIVEDEQGRAMLVPRDALSELFWILKDNIRCVVLNACYGVEQAEAIAQHVDTVVGVPAEIEDEVAIEFATAFYEGIAHERSVQESYQLGCNGPGLKGLPDSSKPELIHRPEVDPGSLYLT